MNHHPLSHFNSDWVTEKSERWDDHFKELAGKPCRILEVGSFEGRSACWFAYHLMSNPQAELFCVDPWFGTGGAARLRLFDMNVALTGRSDQVHRAKAKFTDVQHRFTSGQFDLIYIDGDHHAPAVLTDAALCWDKLKVGGLMLFDDYGLPSEKLHASKVGSLPPGPAIDAFLTLWGDSAELVYKGWQVLVRKKPPTPPPSK